MARPTARLRSTDTAMHAALRTAQVTELMAANHVLVAEKRALERRVARLERRAAHGLEHRSLDALGVLRVGRRPVDIFRRPSRGRRGGSGWRRGRAISPGADGAARSLGRASRASGRL